MAAPGTELQQAIHDVLVADTDLMALVAGIYDSTRTSDGPYPDPFGAADAYVSFGPETVVIDHMNGLRAEDVSLQIDVWSQSVGRWRCRDICHRIERLLDNVPLSLPTHAHAVTVLEQKRILPDVDEAITHGVLVFTVTLEDRD